ncbi:MAG: glutamate racemase [Halofilum sp. (in: g-proteobacteria)]|nr:glutamate racemase [Halofilum sp. (in: g-proteobacteria)]
MTRAGPIGVFDSGFGGVSVLHAIRSALPAETLLYCADHARLPWGERDTGEVRLRARAIATVLQNEGARAIVIACNTATAAAADALRAEFDVPVIGMEPAVKPAAAETRSGVIGVLGTGGTLASARFSGLLARYADGLEVVTRPCPELVDLVETTRPGDPMRQSAVNRAVAPLLAAGADVLVLGCTHFPFLRPEIERAAGDRVVLIDTGPAVARHLAATLGAGEQCEHSGSQGAARFLTTGDPVRLDVVLDALWPGGRFERLALESMPEHP